MTKQRTTPVTSMELLEKPEVEKTSANFQLDDSILNIVDAHEIGTRKTLNSQDFSNTLSRNLKNDYSPQSKQSTPKKLSKDLYILSKRSTALLTTKTNISSFKSDPKLPSSQEGPVTTPIKNIESKSPSKAVNTNAIQNEDPFTLRKRESVEASAHKVPEL